MRRRVSRAVSREAREAARQQELVALRMRQKAAEAKKRLRRQRRPNGAAKELQANQTAAAAKAAEEAARHAQAEEDNRLLVEAVERGKRAEAEEAAEQAAEKAEAERLACWCIKIKCASTNRHANSSEAVLTLESHEEAKADKHHHGDVEVEDVLYVLLCRK